MQDIAIFEDENDSDSSSDTESDSAAESDAAEDTIAACNISASVNESNIKLPIGTAKQKCCIEELN